MASLPVASARHALRLQRMLRRYSTSAREVKRLGVVGAGQMVSDARQSP